MVRPARGGLGARLMSCAGHFSAFASASPPFSCDRQGTTPECGSTRAVGGIHESMSHSVFLNEAKIFLAKR